MTGEAPGRVAAVGAGSVGIEAALTARVLQNLSGSWFWAPRPAAGTVPFP